MTSPHSTSPHPAGPYSADPYSADPYSADPTATTSNDPDQIRREIEQTQATRSSDVDALTEKVSPAAIAQRRVDRVRGTASRWKDKVMGSDTDADPYRTYGRVGDPSVGERARHLAGSASESISGTAQSAASTISDTASEAASTVQGAVQEAPRAVVRQTRGNPLAAGLIAFGAGWLVSSLLPASQREQQLAEQAKERASEFGQPIADAAKQAATEMRDNLQEPAQHAVESVRSTAQDAGQTVADEGRSAAQDVQSHAQGAAETVRQSPPS
jgi:gas vesicle protein